MDSALVLIVDDNPEMLDMMAEALEPLGVRIERAADGQEALDKAFELEPIVIVLDLLLPRISGAQVLATLRARGNDASVILISGATRAPTIGDSVEFLPKPFSAEQLRDAVQRALLHA
jgi:two-component system, chemotaxis family, chemotaxis protein CheY